jgi:hypothetical protein
MAVASQWFSSNHVVTPNEMDTTALQQRNGHSLCGLCQDFISWASELLQFERTSEVQL